MSDNTLGNLESTSRNVKEITEYDIDKVAELRPPKKSGKNLKQLKLNQCANHLRSTGC